MLVKGSDLMIVFSSLNSFVFPIATNITNTSNKTLQKLKNLLQGSPGSWILSGHNLTSSAVNLSNFS